MNEKTIEPIIADLVDRIAFEKRRVAEAEAALWRVAPNTHAIHVPNLPGSKPPDPFEGPGETYEAAYRRLEAVVQKLRECMRTSPTMEGPRFLGWDKSALDRLRRQLSSGPIQYLEPHIEQTRAEADRDYWREECGERDRWIAQAREVVTTFRNFGCPICHGDCASANPPVSMCPMQAAREFLEQTKGPLSKEEQQLGISGYYEDGSPY